MNSEIDIRKKYLPIGTVVLLKGGSKKIMIIGFKARVTDETDEKNRNTVWDYSGCLYPEGLLSSDQILIFNHSQISKVYHLGYHNEEEIEFKKQLNQLKIDENNSQNNSN